MYTKFKYPIMYHDLQNISHGNSKERQKYTLYPYLSKRECQHI